MCIVCRSYSRLEVKGPSEIFRDIRILTYQIWSIKDKINRTITFHKCIYNLAPEVRDTLKILCKYLIFHNILLLVV